MANKSKTNLTVHKGGKKATAPATRNRLDPKLTIVKQVTGNPRREGTFGYHSFSLIKNGITIEKFVQKGGRMKDLRWDLEHGYVKVS